MKTKLARSLVTTFYVPYYMGRGAADRSELTLVSRAVTPKIVMFTAATMAIDTAVDVDGDG